jgi:hypothetical protein
MRWEFKQERGEANRWRWQCADSDIGSVLRMSQLPFKTRDECIEDAAKNGYVDPAAAPSSGLVMKGKEEQRLAGSRPTSDYIKPDAAKKNV